MDHEHLCWVAQGHFTRHPLPAPAAGRCQERHAAPLGQAGVLLRHLHVPQRAPLFTENELRQRMEASDKSIFQALLCLIGNVPGTTCCYWKKFSHDIAARERVAHAPPCNGKCRLDEAPSAQ